MADSGRYADKPKIDLHLHLDGALRVSTIRDLFKKCGKELPTEDLDELAPYCQVGPDCKSLTEFLQKFFFFYDVLKHPDAMERAAYELCEDCAADNVVYFETRFAPILQATEDYPMQAVLESVIRGIDAGVKKFKVRANILLCCYRSESLESSIETVKLADKYRERGVVGVDMAGDETNVPAAPHYEAFKLARRRQIPITLHAGEAGGPQNVREAIEQIGASRIGHGFRTIEDPAVVELVKERGVTLEICPTSNVHTNTVPSLEEHPLKKLAALGVKVTVNSDDPGVSAITLGHEYDVAVARCGLTEKQLAACVRQSVESCFADDSTKQEIRKIVNKAWGE